MKKIVSGDVSIRLFLHDAPCGTSPADTWDEGTELNFTGYWIPNPKDAYSVYATGDSMEGAHIFAGDMLVIDAGKEAQPGNVVVAWLNGDMTVKRLARDDRGAVMLVPENTKYAPMTITPNDDFRILGVVTSVHRKL